jgi:hypothetical protein
MRFKQRLFIIGALPAAGLLIYAAYPFLVYGIKAAFLLLVAAVSALLALPRLLWWLSGALLLSFIYFKLLLQWRKTLFTRSSKTRPMNPIPGRLNNVYEWLDQANPDGIYSQERIRELCSTLAVDFIALKQDLSQTEARKLFLTGDWTRNENLKTYFSEKRRPGTKTILDRLINRFGKSRAPEFLQETRTIINLLEQDRDETDAEPKANLTSIDH